MAEANYSIKAQIEANTRKFKNAIQSAKKVAQNFKKTQESIKDTKLDGDSSGVMKAVKAARDAVKALIILMLMLNLTQIFLMLEKSRTS